MKTPKSVLIVVAHPDDCEFICGGTVATWSQAGTEVHLLVCTDGSKGGTTKASSISGIRRQEQMAAADGLGVKSVEFLSHVDAELEATPLLRGQIVGHIRKLRPDTVVTFDPAFIYSLKFNYINHLDHRAAGLATLDACYPLARDQLSYPGQLKAGLQPHRVSTLLLWNLDSPNFFMDISSTWSDKLKSLKQHQSQFNSNDPAYIQLREIAEAMGHQANTELAEGFIRIKLPE